MFALRVPDGVQGIQHRQRDTVGSWPIKASKFLYQHMDRMTASDRVRR